MLLGEFFSYARLKPWECGFVNRYILMRYGTHNHIPYPKDVHLCVWFACLCNEVTHPCLCRIHTHVLLKKFGIKTCEAHKKCIEVPNRYISLEITSLPL